MRHIGQEGNLMWIKKLKNAKTTTNTIVKATQTINGKLKLNNVKVSTHDIDICPHTTLEGKDNSQWSYHILLCFYTYIFVHSSDHNS